MIPRCRCLSTALVYFAIVILVSLYPGKLLDTVGNFLAPLKIIALVILSVAAIVMAGGFYQHGD